MPQVDRSIVVHCIAAMLLLLVIQELCQFTQGG